MPYTWLLSVYSGKNYQEVLSYVYDMNEDIFPGLDFVVKGQIECKNGRVIGCKEGFLFLIGVDTFYVYPIFKMIEKKIVDSDSVILVGDISSDQVNFENKECWLKNAKCFTNEDNLLDYLENISFKFSDGSFPSRHLPRAQSI